MWENYPLLTELYDAAWLGTHYGVGRFSIGFPANALPTEQVRLRMELLTWHWELNPDRTASEATPPISTGIGEEISITFAGAAYSLPTKDRTVSIGISRMRSPSGERMKPWRS